MEAVENLVVSSEEEHIEWLIDEYGKDLLQLIYCYVKDRNIAEDLLQEVYLTVYLKIGSFQEKSSLKTWVTRITINKCKDYLRTSYFKKTFLTNLLEPLLGIFEKSTEDHVMTEETSDWLASKVLDLQLNEIEQTNIIAENLINIEYTTDNLDTFLQVTKGQNMKEAMIEKFNYRQKAEKRYEIIETSPIYVRNNEIRSRIVINHYPTNLTPKKGIEEYDLSPYRATYIGTYGLIDGEWTKTGWRAVSTEPIEKN